MENLTDSDGLQEVLHELSNLAGSILLSAQSALYTGAQGEAKTDFEAIERQARAMMVLIKSTHDPHPPPGEYARATADATS